MGARERNRQSVGEGEGEQEEWAWQSSICCFRVIHPSRAESSNSSSSGSSSSRTLPQTWRKETRTHSVDVVGKLRAFIFIDGMADVRIRALHGDLARSRGQKRLLRLAAKLHVQL